MSCPRQKTKDPTSDFPPLSPDTVLLSSAHHIHPRILSDGALKDIEPHRLAAQGKEKGNKGDEWEDKEAETADESMTATFSSFCGIIEGV